MKYEKIYSSLMNRGKNRDRQGYMERHHIIPKCLGGTDTKDNLVYLTAREHYIAHRLLTKIYPKNPSLWFAFAGMSRVIGEREYTSHQYEMMKESRSKAMRMDNPVHKMSKEEIDKRMDKLKSYNLGDNNIMRRSKELREFHSDRMKKSNPMTLHPERNHKARPIEVLYNDGTIENYEYAKGLSIEKNIPYATVKWMLKENKGSPKHNIRSIKQKEKA